MRLRKVNDNNTMLVGQLESRLLQTDNEFDCAVVKVGNQYRRVVNVQRKKVATKRNAPARYVTIIETGS